MKRYKLPNDNFIKGYFIDTKICDELIKFFKKISDDFKLIATTYNSRGELGVNKDVKDSTDYSMYANSGLYPYVEYEKNLQKCLDDYLKHYTDANNLPKFNIIEKINIQYYKPGGGFKPWHFERFSKDYLYLKRVLVFMTYLNNVSDGGTDFKYQNITVPAKKGLTLIWPSDWTHTHRSQISYTKEKYIITGWYSIE
jgi:hypothetical protein